jgi:hypothetical protein
VAARRGFGKLLTKSGIVWQRRVLLALDACVTNIFRFVDAYRKELTIIAAWCVKEAKGAQSNTSILSKKISMDSMYMDADMVAIQSLYL